MKRRISGISLIIALLMIVPVFSVGVSSLEGEYEFGEVEKVIYDGEEWVEVYTAELGEVVHFNMTFTYYKTDHPQAHHAKDILVVDTLPDCLMYDIADPEPTSVEDKIITWDFGDLTLENGESIVIFLNATVVAYTDQDGEENLVEVTANETCSQRNLYGYDTAIVICEEPCCELGIEVNKTVWNGKTWVDNYYDDVYFKPGDIIKFKIEIVYEDCDVPNPLFNGYITDRLPYCLDYNYKYDVNTSGFATEPNVIVDEKTITWRWEIGPYITLQGGQYLILEFETVFVEYCCECPGDNYAYVRLWGCEGPDYYFDDDDCAAINCQPPDTTFDKYVKDGEEWAKVFETYTGNTLEFKIELVYYGKEPCDNESLKYIRFVDELPCILEYEGTFESNLGENLTLEISADGKILYFNASLDFELNLGETITIKFKVDVVGCTDCGCDCDHEVNNSACVTAGCQKPFFEMCDKVLIISYGNCPPSTPDIGGPTEGMVGDELEFGFYSTDSDEDQIAYYIDWSDGTEDVSELMDEGVELLLTKVYDEPGEYTVNAMAKDEHGAESEWTYYGHVVIIGEDDEEEPICISIKKFGIGRVGATIKNKAEENLTDVDWNISLVSSRDKLIGKVNVSNNGTIDELADGKSQTVYTGPRILKGSIGPFKFGKVEGQITVTIGEDTYSKEFSGFVISKLVVITKQQCI